MSYAVDLPVINIMIVDDDPAIGELIASFVSREGHKPVICTLPGEALDLIKKEQFHIAFIDINMPVMGGIELASNLKKDNPELEVVFITGFGTFDNAIQAIKVGAYDYLRKPFGISELNLCVKRFQERMLLKEQVKIAEQRYYNLVQNIPCLVFVIREDLELEFINRACEPMLGFSAEEAMAAPGWLMERRESDWSSDVCSSDLWRGYTRMTDRASGRSLTGHFSLRISGFPRNVAWYTGADGLLM
jgi:YesN/AraC family two-component response regulator